MTASELWSKAWPILFALLFFGVIIMIHECGHFACAKLFKVKVNEFSLGMGPALFKRKKGDTLYAVRLFPIGGYVAMEGEDDASEDDRAFNKKPVWQKMIIVVAGALMNLILGFILMVLLLTTSTDLIGTNTIKEFYPDAVSSQYGLQAGDRFVEIDGHHVWSELDLSFLMSRSQDGVFDFVVERDGEKVTLNDVHFATEQQNGITLIQYDFIIIGEQPGFLNIVKNAFTQSASIVRMVWLSVFDLVTGRYGMSELAGPVGTVDIIADVTAQAVSSGSLTNLLTIMAFITINVGVANLLPLPALDGGRFLFLAVEAVRRKPVNPKYEGYVHAAGLALLLLLMVVVTYNDIARIVHGA
ncbi:MAG TPA: site-2 protease family protein [Candidatus Fimenecus excrementavium]|jgi:regulator of sigma E protease|nr:site-2 protease family protein [Candidatus Fimenecus excrementavium]